MYKLLDSALAPATKASYRNALHHYRNFYKTYYSGNTLFPVSTKQLAQFIAVCHHRGLKHSTITSYISAIGYIHKLHNMVNPLDSFLIKKLLHSLRRSAKANKRQPFTIQYIQALIKSIKHTVSDVYTTSLIRAMFLLAFFGLFRVGEITYSSKGAQHVIRRENINFVRLHSKVRSLNITLTQYKHSVGHQASIPIACQAIKKLCPVRSMLRYLHMSSQTSSFLFLHQSGSPVTTTFFRSVLKSCVIACNLDPSVYTAHSFRIGGATLAHQNKMAVSDIKKLGRWKSTAYKKYLRTLSLPL